MVGIAAPETFRSEEEEPISRGVDIILPPLGVPVGELTEEEQLALALKASVDTASEERALKCRASLL